MAQKSLPILNKVNTSMIWYSTYYYKYYKWLSSQNLFLLYFFNKLFVYLDFFFLSCLWVSNYSSTLYYTAKPLNKIYKTKVRFFKPVTAYLINMEENYVIFNIFYKTTLEAFQELNKESHPTIVDSYSQLHQKRLLSSIFYRR